MAPESISAARSCPPCREWLRVAFMVLCLGAMPPFASAGPVVPSADTTLWLRVQRTTWVMQGARRPEHLIYVITDANCPYCHDLWLSLQPLYARGLQVRYVMVGIISSDSSGKAAAIIEARDPSAALDRNERQWSWLPDDLRGGSPPIPRPKPATAAALKANEQLMHDLGVQGTPALIYRSCDHVMYVIRSAADPAKLKSIVSAAAPD